MFRIVLVGPLLWPLFAAAQDITVSSRARAIQASAIVIDAHEDTPLRFHDDHYDIGTLDPRDTDFISLDKVRRGQLGAVFFSICVDPEDDDGHPARRAMDLIDSVYGQTALHPKSMAISMSAEDVEHAHAQHALAALIGIEGGDAIEDDLHLLRDFYRLGVRYMTLTHTHTNLWADSSGDINDSRIAHHEGLTGFGRQVVAEMNRLGMIVDVSHVSDKTFWDVMAVTKRPVIASHSAARALVDSPRNLTDEMLRTIAKTGGVVGVPLVGSFLDPNFASAAYQQHQRMLAAAQEYEDRRETLGEKVAPHDIEQFELLWLEKNKIPRAPMKALIDQIDHIVMVAGIDHVGLGSDSNGRDFLVAGIDSAADLEKITQGLLDRGYREVDIRKILGGNLLRVLREAMKVSPENTNTSADD
ncbi:MAG TPA: dipeptidase [Candidatus Solibacter sp.]|nr:dipeptidase [Candidatus Solibacter sp.]